MSTYIIWESAPQTSASQPTALSGDLKVKMILSRQMTGWLGAVSQVSFPHQLLASPLRALDLLRLDELAGFVKS